MKDSIHFVEISISIEIEIQKESNIIIQKFIYNKRDKNKKYILNNGYILYDKFEERIRKETLAEDNISFLKRIDDDGVVICLYDYTNDDVLKSLRGKRKAFTLVDFAPPNPGCAYCIHKKQASEDFFTCCYKDRYLAKEFKNCKYFKQRKLYKT